MDLQQISDRLEIEEVLLRYTRAIDTGEWDGLDSVDGTELLWGLGGIHHHLMVRTPAGWRSRELLEELVWKRGV